MNLPNYFLADLPSEATLSAVMIGEACATLKRNRAQYLAERPTENLVRVLSGVAEGWLQPGNQFRQYALELGPAQTGFGRATLAKGLDSFFRQLTRDHLHALLTQDLGDIRRLDEFAPEAGEARVGRVGLAIGPEFLVHITAGSIPNPALMSVALGLLTRSAQFVKCATGASLLLRLFAHSIYQTDAKLGACLEIAEWRGGNAPLETALFAQADCVTATGSDETLAAIRARLPVRTRFVGYGHRLSFGYVSSEVLCFSGGASVLASRKAAGFSPVCGSSGASSHLVKAVGDNAAKVVVDAATDVVAWNQLGCLSPHVFYVQSGGDVMPRQLADLLAAELAQREVCEPRGEIPVDAAAHIASRRAIYAVRAAHLPGTGVWHSENSTAWTVVFEEDPRFQTSCLNRFIYVKPVRDLTEALQNADVVREHISTVGLAASPREAQTLARQLARWGAPRVCPLGQMQNPPLTWRHDGRPALADLVTWTDWEEDGR